MLGQTALTDHGAHDAAGGGRRAIVIQAHRHGFANHAGEIRAADGDAKDRQAGVIDGMDGMHAGEFLIHRRARLAVILDTWRQPQGPANGLGQGTFFRYLREADP